MKLPASITPARRRLLAVWLMLLGILLILFAPETWVGLLVLALGVCIEIAGMVLGHRDSR